MIFTPNHSHTSNSEWEEMTKKTQISKINLIFDSSFSTSFQLVLFITLSNFFSKFGKKKKKF